MASTTSVMIVDDEADFVASAAQRLAFEGFQVLEAFDGESALQLLNAGKTPDIILLDIMMPGISGIEVFKRLRAQPATASIPVIFLTVWDRLLADPAIAQDARAFFLQKPFNFDVLIRKIREMTSNA